MRITAKMLLVCFLLISFGFISSVTNSQAAPPPTITDFSAAPASIQSGSFSTLSYATRKADTCIINPGNVSVACNGSSPFSPTATTTYIFTATNANGSSNANVTVTVTLANLTPAAADDSYSTLEDTPLITGNVLTNDGLGDEPTTITAFDATSTNGGTVSYNGDGTFDYSPVVNFVGSDSFSYTITDNDAETSTATVTIDVAAVNDSPNAVDDAFSTPEDTLVTTGNVLTNDDLGDEPTTITAFDPTSINGGSVSNNGDGTFDYTPAANFSGSDSFNYTITDNDLETSTATVSIDVAAVNVIPNAVDDTYDTIENIPVTTGNVLINDELGDEPTTITTFDPTSTNGGTVTYNGDGTFDYTPPGGFVGSDSFTYTITDNDVETSTATVSISVAVLNYPPIANDDTAITDEDTPVTINLVANDSDANGDNLTIGSNTDANYGIVTINGDYTVSYTPNENYNGGDSFSYTLIDGHGGTDTATVSLTINPVNDPPVVQDFSVDNIVNEQLSIVLTGTDVEIDPLTFYVEKNPDYGSLTGTVPNLTYTPDIDYMGPDTMQYKANDGASDSNTATISINVLASNTPPVAVDDSAVTMADIPISSINVLDNDYDDDGDVITVGMYTDPSNGSVVLNGDSTFTYTPDADYSGSDSFTYTIDDGNGGTGTATVSIEVYAQPQTKLAKQIKWDNSNTNPRGMRRIIRTSTGRIYYFVQNGFRQYDYDGFIEVLTSEDGQNWSVVSSHDEWYNGKELGAAVDSQDVVHVITSDWQGNFYYEKFNTEDSSKGDNSWEGKEIIVEEVIQSDIAIDANDVPHIVYSMRERYKGYSCTTLYYANRIGGAWNTVTIIPKEAQRRDLYYYDIAIGLDNIPYILTNTGMFKADANNPTSFHEVILNSSGANLYFVIHQNGDVRVGASYNGNYVHYVHDHTMPWDQGWSSYDSGASSIASGILVLQNDEPITIWKTDTEFKMQKWFDTPVTVATIPSNSGSLGDLTSRWSFYNHHKPEIIDLGSDSWHSSNGHYYWYTNYSPNTVASLSASPVKGEPPLTVDFTDSSEPASGSIIVAWEWDFNNDGITDSTEQNPTHTYTDLDLYSVSLTVTDVYGNTDTAVKQDFILVDVDSDGDTYLDGEDNCLQIYNQTQVDLDGDGIGYHCDNSVDLLNRAEQGQGISSETASDSGFTEVTDAIFAQGVIIQKNKRNSDVISLRADVDAASLDSAIIQLNVSAVESGTSEQLRIYAYNSDGITVQTAQSLDFTVNIGWNDLDVTDLLSLMDDFGFIKFRLAAPSGWIEVTGAEITGTSAIGADDREISVDIVSHDFGLWPLGEYARQEIIVTNTGTGPLTITGLSALNEPFKIISENCNGRYLYSSSSCKITIGFVPQKVGSYSYTLILHSDDIDNPELSIDLLGSVSADNQTQVSGTVTDIITDLPLEGVDVTMTVAREVNYHVEDLHYGNSVFPPPPSVYDLVKYNDNIVHIYSTSHRFRFWNPFNSDQVKVTWNGTASVWDDHYLGQTFTAGASGPLTSVSLLLSWYRGFEPPNPTVNKIEVFIKSAMNGDEDTILARSGEIDPTTIPVDPAGWVNFTFADPVNLIAGQSYYVELWSDFKTGDDPSWHYDSANSYNNGEGFEYTQIYQEHTFDWVPINGDFGLITYVNGQVDQQTTSTCQDCSYYRSKNDQSHSMWLQNGPPKELWGQWHVTLEHIYGPDVSEVHVFFGPYDAAGYDIATDLFDFRFLDELTTTTDVNGNYSFADIYPGEFTLDFSKSGFHSHTESGSSSAGDSFVFDVQLLDITATGDISVSTYSLDFGAVSQSNNTWSQLTVTNNSPAPLTIGDIPAPPRPFSIAVDNCSGIQLYANAADGATSCSINVGFAPEAEGTFVEALEIPSNDQNNPVVSIGLTGTGLLQAPSQISGQAIYSATGLPASGINVNVEVFRGAGDMNLGPGDYSFGDYFYSDVTEIQTNDEIYYVGDNRQTLDMRYPFNTTDPIKISWNGRRCYDDDLIHAQSVTAGSTGLLTKVSLAIDGTEASSIMGTARVVLKSSLTGDEETVLAKSDLPANEIPVGLTWVDFVFDKPAEVQQGQTYIIDINGRTLSGLLYWAFDDGSSYAGGNGFSKVDCLWTSLSGNFQLKTYVDDQLDQEISSGTNPTLKSFKINYVDYTFDTVRLSIYNYANSSWVELGRGNPQWTYFDETIEFLLTDNVADYYDPNGWVSARVLFGDKVGSPPGALMTDSFTIEFGNPDYNSLTDEDGNYITPDLNVGNYTFEICEPGYFPYTSEGHIAQSENISINPVLISAPVPVVQIDPSIEGTTVNINPQHDHNGEITAAHIFGTVSDHALVTMALLGFEENQYAATIENGYFERYVPLRAGDNTIIVTATDECGGQPVTETVNVFYAAGAVEGYVTLLGTGEPLEGVRVSVDNLNYTCNEDIFFWKWDLTDENGYYYIDSIPLGCHGWDVYNSYGYNLDWNDYYSYGDAEAGVTKSKDIVLTNRFDAHIQNLQVANITANSATVSWTTDIPTRSKISYGETPAGGYGFTFKPAFTYDHSYELTDLNSGTLYYFTVTATNNNWKETTANGEFTTLGPVINISANPPSITGGEQVEISWDSPNADAGSCVLDPGNTPVACTGSQVFFPEVETEYTLTATNADGIASKSVTVPVTWPQPVINNFSADKTDAPIGGPILLSWDTVDAEIITLDPGGIALSGDIGTITVNPLVDTTYTLTVDNHGNQASQGLIINVHPAPTVQIYASKTPIMVEETVTLTWSYTDAHTVTIDQGIGDVMALTSYDVTPTATTNYTITAVGHGGTAQHSVEVVVNYPMPTAWITADPQLIQANDPVTLTWGFTNAETVTIDQGIGTVTDPGTQIVNPSATTTYTITATSPYGDTAIGWVRVFVDEAGGYAYGDPSPAEQAHLEAINRARANPEAEAARLGISLYEGLLEGTINGVPRQPVVMNSKLLQAAALHAQDMIDNQFFDHISPTDGRDPYQRITDAGYQYSLAAENIGGRCPADPISAAEAGLGIHEDLFIDAGVDGRGHRLTILNNDVKEVGVGMATGPFQGDTGCYMLSDDYGLSLTDSRSFVTGVVYDDLNQDGLYTAGEGIGNVIIDAVEAVAQTSSASAGGYAIPLDPGTYTITATLPGGFEKSKQITIDNQNVKVDFLYSEFNMVAPTVVDFSSDVYTIQATDTATLSWDTEHAYQVDINGTVVADSGTMQVTPDITTDYTITAIGLEGTVTDTLTITVSASPVPTINFSAIPENIPVGGTSNLIWSSFYTDSCDLQPGIGPVATSDNRDVSPAANTTYTIECTGPVGVTSESVTVTYPQPTAHIMASPIAIISSQSTDLAWLTTDATSITIDNGIGPVADTGSTPVSPTATTIYTITADGPGGSIVDQVTVEVLDQAVQGIEITSPADGETLYLPFTLVKGIVTPGNVENGVTINGYPAEANGNVFFRNALPLVEGANTITATSVLTDGSTATDTITVYVDTSQPVEWISLELSPETGFAPFTTKLTAELYLADASTSTLTYDGPGTINITPVTNTEYDLEILDPGIYTLNFQSTNGHGGQFEQEIMVNVLDKVVFQSHLNDKWQSMAQALSSGQVATATDFFVGTAKQIYSDQFTALTPVLGQIASEFLSAQLILNHLNHRAECELLINRGGTTYSFNLFFEKDHDGIWRIWRF